MSKLVLSIVAAMMLPVLPQAAADEREIDCADETCVAEMFADALSSEVAPQAVRLDSLVTFEPGSTRVYSESRERLQAVAASWRKQVRWSMITVQAYAGQGGNLALAQRRADKIRGYLVRYGVAAEYVTAIGHRGSSAAGSTGGVDLAVELCERPSRGCPRSALAELRTSAR